MRVALVGLVQSGEQALLGLIDKNANICGIFSSDIEKVIEKSGMSREYYCEFKKYATELNCPYFIVEDLNNYYEQLANLKPDLVVIVGWPQIIRKQITGSFLCIGMHPAILPDRRGGAPLNWQIIDGVTTSAVSIIRLEDGVDSGDTLVQKLFSINAHDYISDVVNKVDLLTREAIAEAYEQLNTGNPRWMKQDIGVATYTRRRTPEDGLIYWRDSSTRIYNLIRAISYPFPGAFTFLDGQPLKVWKAKMLYGYRARISASPGEILDVSSEAIIVSTRDNAIGLERIEFGETIYEGESLCDLYSQSLVGRNLGGKYNNEGIGCRTSS